MVAKQRTRNSNTQSNNNNQKYTVGDVTVSDKKAYKYLCYLDEQFEDLVEDIKNGIIDIEKLFSRAKQVIIEQHYIGAGQYLFPEINEFYSDFGTENPRFKVENEYVERFHELVRFI